MSTKKCRTCGCIAPLTDFYTNGTSSAGNQKYKPDCKPCFNKNRKQQKTATIIKILAETQRKLECELCGYNKNQAALTFHHMDEEEKDFEISEGATRNEESLRLEINKCALLCHNCHMEIHYPHLKIVGDSN